MDEMKIKMKNGSHRYDINRPSLDMDTDVVNIRSASVGWFFKQHLSNMWSSVHEIVKHHWGWVKKKRCLQKTRTVFSLINAHSLLNAPP